MVLCTIYGHVPKKVKKNTQNALKQSGIEFNLFHLRQASISSFQETTMLDSKTGPNAAQPPLPLFRPEVLASQQQKFFGNVLGIRPLSGTFFIWLGLILAGGVLGILILGQYLNIKQTVSDHKPTLVKDIEGR